ncbi:MAG TPA: putative sugar nucleotidyl transferase, partial [Bacteroidia bacterium]|nr:putative sugar nucleotidyl transferase [Bacteroidia bacterium]
MNAVLFDREETWTSLLPFTFTRPVAEIRNGILTVRERWEKALGQACSSLSRDYLAQKYPARITTDNVFIASHVHPNAELVVEIKDLGMQEALFSGKDLIAFRAGIFELKNISAYKRRESSAAPVTFEKAWDLFRQCGERIREDCEILVHSKIFSRLSDTVTVIGPRDLVFLEEGARAEACVLNTTGGPIYLGKDAEVMEGCLVRGPFALGEHSTLKMGAKVYGPSVIGPHCKVGGEFSNSLMFGYSNKAHDGFVGNSVIGEWCNLGADTNCSNLKNNYGNVKVYSYAKKGMEDSGLQFCGLMMGDFSRSGINTMFNTGTVVGVGCNIFGGGFPP